MMAVEILVVQHDESSVNFLKYKNTNRAKTRTNDCFTYDVLFGLTPSHMIDKGWVQLKNHNSIMKKIIIYQCNNKTVIKDSSWYKFRWRNFDQIIPRAKFCKTINNIIRQLILLYYDNDTCIL